MFLLLSLSVTEQYYLVNLDGQNPPQPDEPVQHVDWQSRAEYVIKYSAEDASGNSAEQVYKPISLQMDHKVVHGAQCVSKCGLVGY
jgi:hypothetical protein